MPLPSPRFWTSRGLASTLLLPAAWAYQAGYRLRRAIVTPQPLPAKLLCIGNLVAGGAGKTPVALAIGEWAKAHGIRACFLSKGYGGNHTAPLWVDTARHRAEDVGDEALLLAECLPTLVGRDRAGAARLAAASYELILMDDGFQNPHLQPDIALVVIDPDYGFGNGRSLPAGPLREPVAYGLRRADAVVAVCRSPDTSLPALERPVLGARLETRLPDAPARAVAFSGIARPEQFFAALERQCGVALVERHAFADHHPFTPEELAALQEAARRHGVPLVTTAKDAVRLPEALRREVLVAQAALNWHNTAEFDALLAPLLAPKEA